MPRCAGCCFDGSSACGLVAHPRAAGWHQGRVLWSPWCCLVRGREGGISLSTEGSQGLGLGLAKPPVLARGCRAVSEAAGTCCQDCALRHHRHPGLGPVPQLSHCTFSRPLARSQQCPCSLQPLKQCLPPCPAQGSITMSHILARSSCSTERWGYLPALPIPTRVYCFGKSTSKC